MAKKMLGKVVAGAALGGAGLLAFTPGMAYAGGHDDEGKVIAKPHVVKAGDTVDLLQICSEPQEHAYLWSKVTGKVDLHAARDGEHGDWADRGGDWSQDADQGPDGKDAHGDDHGKGPDGKDDQGKDDQGKDDQGKYGHGKGREDKGREDKGREDKSPEGKGPEGKGPEGKDDQGKYGHGPGEAGMPQPPADAPQPGGRGAGAAAAQGPEEYGQAAEPGWDAADWANDEHGKDGKDGHGPDGKDEHGFRPEAKDQYGKDGKDEHRAWPEAKDEYGKDGKDGKDEHRAWPEAKDEYGKDGKDEHGFRPETKDEYGKDGKDEHGFRPETKDEYGKDSKDEYGKNSKDEYGKNSKDEYGKNSKDEYGNEWQGGNEYGRGGDEAGWEHGKDFVYYGEARVSEDAHPGRYELRGSCGEGELVVLPHGGVDGGDGGMATTGLDRGLATGGTGMIGAAALGGLVLMRRRRAGDLA